MITMYLSKIWQYDNTACLWTSMSGRLCWLIEISKNTASLASDCNSHVAKNSSPVAYMKNMICINKQDPGLTQYIGQDKHKISLFSVQI